ncbi:MAG: phosphoribosylanthranilate isomerase [Actinomycetia bacterium]|nr:phosphoribosylanthranilate isomerase [Actinomycetes bacterium]
MFVKICGITRPADAVDAVDAGADAIGLNFVPESRRRVDLAQAHAILAATPPHVMTVGVFRDHSAGEILGIARELGLDSAQLHGDDYTSAIAARVQTVILAMAAEDVALRSLDEHPAGIVMLDGPAPGSRVPVDWTTVGDLVTEHRILLAGGLRPDNVDDTIRHVRPWGVDVASSVDATPGHKDPAAMTRFVTQAPKAATKP